MKTQPIIAFLLGLIVGGGITSVLVPDHHHDSQHPIANPYDGEYHVHADFHIVVNNTRVNLDDDMFMTTSEQTLHPDLHLHDNNGDVKHIHAEDKTFVEFLESLQINLTDSCITLDNQYCADETNVLRLYVNGEVYPDAIEQYVPVDDDNILVYYGLDDAALIAKHLSNVPDDACYYSGTCPERGTAPPESCGETCEL